MRIGYHYNAARAAALAIDADGDEKLTEILLSTPALRRCNVTRGVFPI
jgi:hypothetical protein